MWLPSYATLSERFLRILVVVFAVTVMLFLIAPLFITVPLSFSQDPFFTLPVREYSKAMASGPRRQKRFKTRL